MGWLNRSSSETLTETVLTEAADLHVDEENGVIRGVRIINRNSLNNGGNREYGEQALNDGLRLYEGAEVNIDHPAKGQEASPRAFIEGWGVLKNIKRVADGDVGDLHYLKEHAATPLILERHKRGFPLGLSHNALGKTVTRNSKQFVESLQRVHSVDLVRRPATTRSLMEGFEDVTTLAEFIGSIKDDHADDLDLLETLAASPVAGPAPMAAPADPKNNVKAALVAALHALAETADEATLKKTIGALMSAAKPAETKPADSAALKESIAEAVVAAVAEATKPLTEQIATLERAALIRNVMESHGITAAGIGPERLKTLTESADEAAMKTLIESWPPAVRHSGPKPGFQAAGVTLTEQASAAPKSTAGVRQLIRSR